MNLEDTVTAVAEERLHLENDKPHAIFEIDCSRSSGKARLALDPRSG